MKATLTISTVLCLLLICSPATAGPDILSAIPADAYGFIATNNLQASYDNIMLFGRALGVPVPDENMLLFFQGLVGEIDLNGPAAIILLDPQRFPETPVALLFSAADAQAIFKAHQAKPPDTDEELPPGVVKGTDGYVAVKNGFVVFVPEADHAVAVLASQETHRIMPAAKQAFDKGQIVLAGDLQGAAPFMIQTLNKVQDQMNAQMAAVATQIPQMAATMEMVSLCMDLAQSLVGQSDKLVMTLDINAQRAVLTERVIFKADSAAAACLNAQVGLPVPTYSALPGGSFLMAGAINVLPENNHALANTILGSFMNLPSIKEKFSAEQIQQMTIDLAGTNTVVSGTAFTLNLGSPMTGMINMVCRYDVSDSALYKELSKKECSASAMWAQAFGGPPMEFIYTAASENYSGVDIDTIKMEMTPPEPPAEDDPMAQQMQMMMAQQMQMMAMMYGPDMTFRLAAPNEKQVLFVMGGSGRMERAINVAQGNGSVLADDPRIIQAAAKLPANRFAEAHLDLTQIVPMIGMFAAMAGAGGMPAAPAGQTPDAPLISCSASAEDSALRVDLVVPAESVRTLISLFGPASPAPEVPSEDFEEDLE